jgi:MFS family permease
VAAAGIASPAFALTADLATEGGEGRQMSLITMGFTLGIAIGPLLAGLLAVISYELPFVVIGFLCLLDVPLVLKYLPETVQSKTVIFQPQESS